MFLMGTYVCEFGIDTGIHGTSLSDSLLENCMNLIVNVVLAASQLRNFNQCGAIVFPLNRFSLHTISTFSFLCVF